MAKAKKRVTTRKKASKRGEASAKSSRKKIAKRATTKKRPRKTSQKRHRGRWADKGSRSLKIRSLTSSMSRFLAWSRVTEYETQVSLTTPNRGGPETEE